MSGLALPIETKPGALRLWSGLTLRLANLLAVGLALGCFYRALWLTNPIAPALLSARSLPLPPPSAGGFFFNVPDVATWPLHAVYLLAWPAQGFGHGWPRNQVVGLIWAGAAIALVILAALLNATRQNHEAKVLASARRNVSAKIAIGLFAVGLALNLGDLARVVWLPPAWDNVALWPGFSRGMAIRAAEVVVSTYLVSMAWAMSHNAFDVSLYGPLWIILQKLRRGVTQRLAVFVALLPWLWVVVNFSKEEIASAASAGKAGAEIGVVVVIALFALPVFGLLSGMWTHVRDLLRFLAQVFQPVAISPPAAQSDLPPVQPNGELL